MVSRSRRRGPRVVWLPPATTNRIGGTASIGTQPGAFDFFVGFAAGTIAPGITSTGIIPLVSDIPTGEAQFAGLATNTLSDIYGSSYRLRRVVGKIFISCPQTQGTAQGVIPRYFVTAGIIVLRVQPDGTPLQSVPGGYSPSIITSWADPWIWRRSWILDNGVEAGAVDLKSIYPETNTQYGSVMDGPHVDQRTARVVDEEERLFLVVGVTNVIVANAGGTAQSEVRVTGELRFVASMRKTAGNRGNSSR